MQEQRKIPLFPKIYYEPANNLRLTVAAIPINSFVKFHFLPNKTKIILAFLTTIVNKKLEMLLLFLKKFVKINQIIII